MRDYVLCRIMEPLILIAAKRGVPEGELVQGLSFTHDDCRRAPYRRLPWDEFTRYLTRLEKAVGDELIDDVVETLRTDDTFSGFRQIGGLFCSPQLYFWMAHRVFAPLVLPVLNLEVEQLTPRRQRVTSRLPDHLENCPIFFQISGVMMSMGPTTLGMAPAQVQTRITPRGAVFTIDFPPSLGLIARGRRMVDALTSSQHFMEELLAQGQTLEESYEALRISDESFRTLMERSPEAIMIFDEESILFANDAFAALLGRDNGERFVGQSVDALFAHVEDASRDLLCSKGQENPITITLRDDDEKLVQVEARTLETTFEGRDVWISLLRDVSFRNEVMARAMEMDRLINTGTLAAGIAHEINNPITAVQLNLQVLQEELQRILKVDERNDVDPAIDEIMSALNASIRGVRQAAQITEELKNIGRDVAEYREPVDLREAVENAIKWVRPKLIGQARLKLHLHKAGPVKTNLSRIQQVVLNLLLNSAHALSYRGDTDAELRVMTGIEDEEAIIEIDDNGGGIPEEIQERIFEPFFTTKKFGEGTGLGLFISRQITENLGGTLCIESTPGVGTTARIIFPLHVQSQKNLGAGLSAQKGSEDI